MTPTGSNPDGSPKLNAARPPTWLLSPPVTFPVAKLWLMLPMLIAARPPAAPLAPVVTVETE